MGLITYARIGLLVDSVLQVQANDVSVSVDSKAQDVETLIQGLAGFTPGAKQLEINAKWALPVAGAEFDVLGAAARGTVHSLQIPYGDKTIISQGIWKTGTLQGSVNSNTSLEAKFTGTFDPPR